MATFVIEEIEAVWMEYSAESSHFKDQVWVRDKTNSKKWDLVTVRYLSNEWNEEALYEEYCKRFQLTYRSFPTFRSLKPPMIRFTPPETCACSLHINWEEIVTAFMSNLPEVHHNASHLNTTEIDFQADFPRAILCLSCGARSGDGVGLLRPFVVTDLPMHLKSKWEKRVPKSAFLFYDKLKSSPMEFARSLLCQGVLNNEWKGSQLVCAGFSENIDCQLCGLQHLIPKCNFVQTNTSSKVEWEMHESVPETDDEGKTRRYFRSMPKSTSMASLWNTLSDWFLYFVQHQFRLLWTRQYEKVHLRNAIYKCQQRVLSVRADWAMNFPWVFKVSTQREFFKRMQTMLFTAVCEFATHCETINATRMYKVVVIVACPPGHKDGRATTAAFNTAIDYLADNYGGPWDIILRGTDNCGYQFKFTPAIQYLLSQIRKYKTHIVCWFTVPEHGKFEGDGHHGALKSQVSKDRDRNRPTQEGKYAVIYSKIVYFLCTVIFFS